MVIYALKSIIFIPVIAPAGTLGQRAEALAKLGVRTLFPV